MHPSKNPVNIARWALFEPTFAALGLRVEWTTVASCELEWFGTGCLDAADRRSPNSKCAYAGGALWLLYCPPGYVPPGPPPKHMIGWHEVAHYLAANAAERARPSFGLTLRELGGNGNDLFERGGWEGLIGVLDVQDALLAFTRMLVLVCS